MPNYELGKIYKIIDNTNDNIYIGSTCEHLLSIRLAKHRAKYRMYIKNNSSSDYYTSFEILKNDDFSIILVEDYPCENKDQLRMRERYHIENSKCVNKRIDGRTDKEYGKFYREKNKEKLLQQYETNKEVIKLRHKEYRLKNRDTINEKKREKRKETINEISREEDRIRCRAYYLQNKEAINEKKREQRRLKKLQL
jgi:hypothetical protein